MSTSIPQHAVYDFLRHEGEANANGDYRNAPTEFSYVSRTTTYLDRLLVHLRFRRGSRASGYGHGKRLANGYSVEVKTGDKVILDLCGGIPIRSNADFARYCYDLRADLWGSGNDYLHARWTFARAGEPLFLDSGDRICITFSDDLTDLVEHHFMLQGYFR